MLFQKSIFATAAAALLFACAAPANRLDMATLHSTLALRALVDTVMIRTVSLPSYAAAEELAVQTPEGFIASDAQVLWADTPERAVTLLITRHLNDILTATAGPDPWPFVGLPDVAVDVRITEMIARSDGTFSLRGQFFVGGDGIDFPNAAHRFAIAQPLTGKGLPAVARAQAAAVLDLSEQIARSVAR